MYPIPNGTMIYIYNISKIIFNRGFFIKMTYGYLLTETTGNHVRTKHFSSRYKNNCIFHIIDQIKV